MPVNTRGFDKLIGETVVSVDTTSINVVHIKCASGKVVSVDADEQHYGIGIVQVNDWSEPVKKS